MGFVYRAEKRPLYLIPCPLAWTPPCWVVQALVCTPRVQGCEHRSHSTARVCAPGVLLGVVVSRAVMLTAGRVQRRDGAGRDVPVCLLQGFLGWHCSGDSRTSPHPPDTAGCAGTGGLFPQCSPPAGGDGDQTLCPDIARHSEVPNSPGPQHLRAVVLGSPATSGVGALHRLSISGGEV